MTAKTTPGSWILPPHLLAIGEHADRGIDWPAIGLKSGVEIHQQLLTKRKLFCRCPAGLYSKKYDAEVLRHMRPTLSELGEYDGTALMEFKTKKDILYRLNRKSVCTYEMDDTPPFLINQEALDIALEIALFLGCSIVGELHVIRKQYLDGSIPTGFQRTAIVGVNGSIPFRDRRLNILQVAVEEDACREVSDRGHLITFLTDRLSMPLVEVVTAAELRLPSEVMEATEIIGRLMRTTGRVRRGAGATRQDVNVSVTGGTRVEIKGVPSVKLIPHLVRNEGLRQVALLKIAETLRGHPQEPLGEARRSTVTDILQETRSEVIRRALGRGDIVGAIRIRNAVDILTAPTVPPLNFAHELAGRVRVVACLPEPPYVLHPHTQGPDALSNREWRALRKRLRSRSEDALVVVWGHEQDVQTALSEIEIRFADALKGVPNETRQVQADGLTDFERILPGPDRMYPDTDLPPVPIHDEQIEVARKRLPEFPWDRQARYRAAGLPEQMAYGLSISPRADLFDAALKQGLAPKLVAHLILNILVDLRRKGMAVSDLTDAVLLEVLTAIRDRILFREALPAVLAEIIRRLNAGEASRDPTLDAVLMHLNFEPADRDSLAVSVQSALSAAVPPRGTDRATRLRYYMGKAMQSLRGRADGKMVAEIVTQQLEPKASPQRS